jgi:dihydroorotate dehydrogenase/Pyruvate/2-oxoacid:ferredoxin oxidoreductase delta subunit
MTDGTPQSALPCLDVTLAGVHFRSPIGLAPIGGGSHFGRPEPDEAREAHVRLRFMLDHVRAGSSFLYLNFSYLTEATLLRLLEAAPAGGGTGTGEAWGERFMRAETRGAPYGVEGLYATVSPGPGTPSLETEEAVLRCQTALIGSLRRDKPEGVPIFAGVIGCGGLPDAYVDAARKAQELGVDLIELNFHCPLQAGMRDGVDNALEHRFPAYSQGGLMGEHPDAVQEIVREVVRAVTIPVGAKFSAEVGFPRIVALARRVRDAGAEFIHVGGAAVGIAPPDIYNRGRPLWPFVDGNPFCLTSGSWMRRVCYRDVAAVARFVPGLDIVASGGLVTPEHCIEAMMLGATLTQVCTGVMEQGRGLLSRSTAFLRRFLAEQGYAGAEELIGLGQPYISYPEETDVMAGQLVGEVDDEKCTRCGHCYNNMCVAIYSDHGKSRVDGHKCTGCGACAIACQVGALKLVPRVGHA